MAIKFEDNFRTIAENLFTLEVNTILAESISGKKMPQPEHAVLDVAGLYEARLVTLGVAPAGDIKAGLQAFDDLRTRASKAISQLAGLAEPDRLMLCRIRDNSDQLKGIFIAVENRGAGIGQAFTRREVIDRKLKLELAPDELVTLRKIWEIGTEEIAYQTTIQLDGDVVTRMVPEFAKDKDFLDVHQLGVSTSVKFWSRLVSILGSFISGIVDLIRGK